MDIKDYFDIIWRRKWIVILTTVAAVVVAVVGTGMIRPVYQASTTIRVAASASGPLGATASSISAQLINTAAQIAASRHIRDQVITKLSLKEVPVISAAVIPQTELIKITVEASNPQTAALIANTLAEILSDQGNQLYIGGKVSSQDVLAQQLAQYKLDLDQAQKAYDAAVALNPPAPEKVSEALGLLQLKQKNYDALLLDYNNALLQQEVRANMVTVVEQALPPRAPIAPQAANNYVLGFVLGLFFGIVLAFIAESFDPTAYTTGHVEKAAGMAPLVKIPGDRKARVLIASGDTSSVAEAFRGLAAGMLDANHGRPGKVFLVTSAEPRQGKSTVVANLATVLAEYGASVVAVDCDMRRPELHKLFELPNETGLANVLQDQVDLESQLKQPANCISVLTSGVQAANPSQLLGSPKMAKLVSNLRQQFDFVLLDTPALLAVSDSRAIIQNAEIQQTLDEVFVVVRQAHAQREPIQAASRFLRGLANTRTGIILTEADDAPGYAYYRTQRA
ncbi:MAG: polysaccharide biosynthesis tyrosine autokinase [Anaerolineae bacterium]